MPVPSFPLYCRILPRMMVSFRGEVPVPAGPQASTICFAQESPGGRHEAPRRIPPQILIVDGCRGQSTANPEKREMSPSEIVVMKTPRPGNPERAPRVGPVHACHVGAGSGLFIRPEECAMEWRW